MLGTCLLCITGQETKVGRWLERPAANGVNFIYFRLHSYTYTFPLASLKESFTKFIFETPKTLRNTYLYSIFETCELIIPYKVVLCSVMWEKQKNVNKYLLITWYLEILEMRRDSFYKEEEISTRYSINCSWAPCSEKKDYLTKKKVPTRRIIRSGSKTHETYEIV